MEGLIFFIAMIVFIVRTMNKIKKAAGRGKKPGSQQPPKPSPVKDKLEELIRNMEAAEKLKKEGKGADKAEELFRTGRSSDDESSSADFSRDDEFSYSRTSSDAGGFGDGEKYKAAGSQPGSEYDLKDNVPVKDKPQNGREAASDGQSGKRRRMSNISGNGNKSSLNQVDRSLSGFTASSLSMKKKKRKDILSSLSEYPALQRAVVLKEILDSPVSDKY